jgi:hypothetical protein
MRNKVYASTFQQKSQFSLTNQITVFQKSANVGSSQKKNIPIIIPQWNFLLGLFFFFFFFFLNKHHLMLFLEVGIHYSSFPIRKTKNWNKVRLVLKFVKNLSVTNDFDKKRQTDQIYINCLFYVFFFSKSIW